MNGRGFEGVEKADLHFLVNLLEAVFGANLRQLQECCVIWPLHSIGFNLVLEVSFFPGILMSLLFCIVFTVWSRVLRST